MTELVLVSPLLLLLTVATTSALPALAKGRLDREMLVQGRGIAAATPVAFTGLAAVQIPNECGMTVTVPGASCGAYLGAYPESVWGFPPANIARLACVVGGVSGESLRPATGWLPFLNFTFSAIPEQGLAGIAPVCESRVCDRSVPELETFNAAYTGWITMVPPTWPGAACIASASASPAPGNPFWQAQGAFPRSGAARNAGYQVLPVPVPFAPPLFATKDAVPRVAGVATFAAIDYRVRALWLSVPADWRGL